MIPDNSYVILNIVNNLAAYGRNPIRRIDQKQFAIKVSRSLLQECKTTCYIHVYLNEVSTLLSFNNFFLYNLKKS